MKPSRKSAFVGVLLVLAALLATGPAISHPVHEPLAANHAAPPLADASAPNTQTIDGLTGPTQTRGVVSVEELGIIHLSAEFPAMQGRQMRARVFTIAPGGVIAIHAHEQRPGYAMILDGSIVEHRNDAPGPIVRNAGDIAIEKGGVAHWWENVSGDAVRALVVDIVGAD
ncbi:cupin domain-containing protein [Pseudazoarcus pumilus]|nr:cupin domain-containing protein [Pseudazoarcus pumilus]